MSSATNKSTPHKFLPQSLPASTTKFLWYGLGNPGKTFEHTRHNAGVIFLEELQKALNYIDSKSPKQIKGETVYVYNNIDQIVYPSTTFMNESGIMLRQTLKYLNLDMMNLIVAYDDLDLKLGEFKLVRNSHPKVHNGINSVIRQLGGADFYHLRIGIDNRDAIPTRLSGADYVLAKFKKEEEEILRSTLSGICMAISADLSKSE